MKLSKTAIHENLDPQNNYKRYTVIHVCIDTHEHVQWNLTYPSQMGPRHCRISENAGYVKRALYILYTWKSTCTCTCNTCCIILHIYACMHVAESLVEKRIYSISCFKFAKCLVAAKSRTCFRRSGCAELIYSSTVDENDFSLSWVFLMSVANRRTPDPKHNSNFFLDFSTFQTIEYTEFLL